MVAAVAFTVIVGVPDVVCSVRMFDGVELLSRIQEAAVASSVSLKITLPIVRELSRWTVLVAVKSTEPKSAVLSAPSAMVVFSQLFESLHKSPSVVVFHVPVAEWPVLFKRRNVKAPRVERMRLCIRLRQ